MADNVTVTVPWDVYEAIEDTIRDQHAPYATFGMPRNIMLWSSQNTRAVCITITPQRETETNDDEVDTAGAPARVADAKRNARTASSPP